MRAAPFYCPYCGETDLVPDGDEAGSFHCETCDRRFQLKFVGLGEGAT
jgi:transcription elongation factor Elf1